MPVLLVVTSAEEAVGLMRWGARFARARETTLDVLYPARAVKPQPLTELAPEDSADLHPVRKAIRDGLVEISNLFPEEEEGKAPRPSVTLRTLAHPDAVQAVLEAVATLKADLLVVDGSKEMQQASEQKELGARLLHVAPCDMMLLRAGSASGKKCNRILAPAAGGPHAAVSLRLSEKLAFDDDAVVTPLYVEPKAGAEAEEVGNRQLVKAMSAAGVHHSDRVVPEVVLADSPTRGIAKCAQEGDYDLILVGASNQGYVSRVLFGSVPERLMAGPEALAVAVIRRAPPIADRAREAFRLWVERWIPQLAREDRVALFEKLQNGSKFGIDFFALIGLSTAIASLGLLQNSSAVVIGAMLVAPLMTPMIGAGFGLVQGNVVLVRDASKSILLGFLTAMTIGYLLGLAFGATIPGRGLTAELLARTQPNALDLLVAFLSGMAAAYALARPGLSGALPGVAIAAALVPPIGTVGISIAQGAYGRGYGAALLFGTNLVAIVVGAATCFRLIGVVAGGVHGRGRLWARRLFLVLVLTSVVIAFPLGSRLLAKVAKEKAHARLVVPPQVHSAFEHHIEGIQGMALVAVEPIAGVESIGLEVVVAALYPPEPTLADTLAKIASEMIKEPVTVQLVGLRTRWVSSGSSSAAPR